MTLIAHAPLQNDLQITTYEETSVNGVYPVKSKTSMNTTESTTTFVDIDSDIRVSGIKALTLSSGKNLSSNDVPSGVHWISFWASFNNTWSLYLRNNASGILLKGSSNGGSLTTDFNVSYYQKQIIISTANTSNPVYITDIRFFKFSPDDIPSSSDIFAMLNKHPKTPTFGFYQQSHNESIGIIGNQISNSLVAYKKGDDDLSFNLADIRILCGCVS